MPAPLAPFALAGALTLWALFGGDDDDDDAPPPVVPTIDPDSLSCDAALTILGPSIGGPAALLLTMAPTDSTKSSALALAVGFESSASQPGTSPQQRAALLKGAKCLRAYAASSAPVEPPGPPAPPPPPVVPPPPPPPPKVKTPALALPVGYEDSNGISWLITQETSTRWLGMLDQAPPSGVYASGLPFVRSTREQVIQAIDERAAIAAGG